MSNREELQKTYDPLMVEQQIYDEWLEKQYFHAIVDSSKKPFTIVIPPPNITGQLHMGHALDNTMQDVLIRWKRMQGYSALWLPGTDHASIATEAKIVEQLAKEGLTKYDLGRENFLKKAWEWKAKYGGRIVEQLKKLGFSCDWSRERFTMDEGCNRSVVEVFINLYNKGLIYQGDRIINWCPECKTALSDAEVEYEEDCGNIWYIRYPILNEDSYIVIATTRPETIPGDTAVAVHPDDTRYKHLIGKKVILPLLNKEIPIIADTYVEREFGTGAVKITPAHDPNDFEVGVRHNLPIIRIMHDDGKMNDYAGIYNGLDRYEARLRIIEDLKKNMLIDKIKDHVHNVGHCYRCSTVVEPIISKQWFVSMKPLAKPAIEAVKTNKVEFIPQHFEKIYYNWMENIHDWCISRQLWWGHRIPAYYCEKCGKTYVAKEAPSICSQCGNKVFRQDEDVLDTWFSSALWPFSTLGWPDVTADMNYFYPTSVLVTGYDIIFFWVARMIFSGIEQTGKVPFKHVFVHGIVRDAQGKKMSKSLGNGIDPLEVIDKYGADALRFSLVISNSPGNDMRFNWEKVEACRNFTNKIWNASRFILMNMETTCPGDISEQTLDFADKWILKKHNDLVKEITDNLEHFELGIAAQKLYDFIWNEFCDWYIELCKPKLYNENLETRKSTITVLSYVLANTLKLIHPFMPFISEKIWLSLTTTEGSIMVSEWPSYHSTMEYQYEANRMEEIMEIIRSIRNTRTDMGVPPSKRTKITLIVPTDWKDDLENSIIYFEKLAFASSVYITDIKQQTTPNTVSIVTSQIEILIPLEELVDVEIEKNRLKQEQENLFGEIARAESKLSNQGFLSKAPQKIIEDEQRKLHQYKDMLLKIKARLYNLQ